VSVGESLYRPTLRDVVAIDAAPTRLSFLTSGTGASTAISATSPTVPTDEFWCILGCGFVITPGAAQFCITGLLDIIEPVSGAQLYRPAVAAGPELGAVVATQTGFDREFEGVIVMPGEAVVGRGSFNAGAAANTATIITENNSAYYRIIGHEITTSSTTASPLQSSVVMLDNADTSDSTVCNHIILDRCYVHGSADGAHSGRRGVWLSGENLAVIDSSVTGFYDDGSDSQAILVYQGNGPFLIDNNYLTGASENINFGGIDPTISNSVPQDITITRNHLFKPLAWIGAGHNVKNLFETKNSRRLLIEGNVLENNWADGQSGPALLLTPRNQQNTAPWCGVFDTTIRLNKFINVGAGINVSGDDDVWPSQRTDRVLIENNLLLIVDPSTGADNRVFQILRGPEYTTIRHNTAVITGGSSLYIANTNGGQPKGLGIKVQDNILISSTYGFFGNGNQGTSALTAEFDAQVGTYNVMIFTQPGTYPSPTYTPANEAAIGFTNYAGGDYSLTGASAYHNAASDGTDIGCDISALNTAISGVA